MSGEIRQASHTVKNLKPGTNYIFLVRAENSQGVGDPSQMSNVVKTKGDSSHEINQSQLNIDLAIQRLGSEQLVKLHEVKSVNASAMELNWKVL